MKWQCKYGHKWLNTTNNILRGQWCPECSKGIGERIARQHFEKIFNKPFPSVRPDWLRSPKGYKLELDGFNDELKIAFEYQGRHHSELTFHHKSMKSLECGKSYDELKIKECKKRGIKLILIPQTSTVSDSLNLKQFLLSEFKKKKIKIYNPNKEYTLDLKNAYAFDKLKKFNEIAKIKGWKILDKTYISTNHHLTVTCNLNHQFKILPSNISKRNCRMCGVLNRSEQQSLKNISKLKKIAQSKGGTLLSTDCKSQKSKAMLICGLGHTWTTTAGSITNGTWCPKCALKVTSSKRKTTTLLKIKELAVAKDGKCFSNVYVDKSTPLSFICKNGHSFSASWWTVSHGGWCKKCKNTSE